MSFIFTPNAAFEWPVTVCTPKGGGYDETTITGLFEIMDDVEFFAPGENVQSMSAGIDLEIERIMEVFKGWKTGEVLDPAKNPIEPTAENIRRFLGYRPARLAVTDAYANAMTPNKGYRAGN